MGHMLSRENKLGQLVPIVGQPGIPLFFQGALDAALEENPDCKAWGDWDRVDGEWKVNEERAAKTIAAVIARKDALFAKWDQEDALAEANSILRVKDA